MEILEVSVWVAVSLILISAAKLLLEMIRSYLHERKVKRAHKGLVRCEDDSSCDERASYVTRTGYYCDDHHWKHIVDENNLRWFQILAWKRDGLHKPRP